MAELTKERFKKVASDRFDKDVISRPTISYWGDAWRRLKKKSCGDVFACIIDFMYYHDDCRSVYSRLGFRFGKWH